MEVERNGGGPGRMVLAWFITDVYHACASIMTSFIHLNISHTSMV